MVGCDSLLDGDEGRPGRGGVGIVGSIDTVCEIVGVASDECRRKPLVGIIPVGAVLGTRTGGADNPTNRKTINWRQKSEKE